jgi:hypothetical protein
MSFVKYFVELIKQDGPSQQTKVLVPFSPSMDVDSATGVHPTPQTADIPDGSITTAKLADGAVTPVKASNVESITASTDGTGTGAISATTRHATVTSSGSTKIVTLPSPVVGKMLTLDVGANGFKLQTTAPATIGINGGTGASAVSAIAANSTLVMICVSLTSWKGFYLDADSDVAKVAAAA